MIVRVLKAAVILIYKPFWANTDPTGDTQFLPKSLQDDYSSKILLESVQDVYFCFTHNQLEITHSACRNKDSEEESSD